MSDYSCYVFPILRGLEAYLKYLFSLCNINIGESFGGIFNKNVLESKYQTQICNRSKVDVLEEVYRYLRANRHVVFHANQIVVATKIITNPNEARTIIVDVAQLIERTYNSFT